MTDPAGSATTARHHPMLWPVLATLLIIGWSSGFVGIRYASQEASVMLLLFWRTLISGMILLPFALAIGPRISRDALKGQALFGIMSVFLYLGGFALAIEQKVPTGLVALIADLLPLAIAALSHPVLGERLTARQWQGTAIAVAGVLIVSLDSLSFGTAPAWAYGLTIASMIIFAGASVLYRRRKTPHMPVHQSLCIHMLTGSVLFGLCAWTQGSLVPPISSEFAIGMAWLVLIATYLAYAVYYTSLRLFPAAKVSAAIYLSPPVTMLWAWMLFSEPLTLTMLTGLAVTLVGVWMTSQD
ncbi:MULTISPECIES: DMT family transporter [Agrobacterium]|uniref:DMT family transporter n=1 Tax=Agrobacterium TaxID=357 RepID=UPI001C231FDB|nr:MULTISPECIES: DMT family transporter [Agrobacterium]MDA5639341.1 DMT family transporter [Agrobacterium sp. ST15.13.013]MDA6999184.1 DMT family transporter [Agrobacterium salinitolerans]QXC52666.1 DMT family transporter [Agrobacterium salinitolerans]QXC52839.1 DMT family transporter [Agrobacterium salinitolerans]